MGTAMVAIQFTKWPNCPGNETWMNSTKKEATSLVHSMTMLRVLCLGVEI